MKRKATAALLFMTGALAALAGPAPAALNTLDTRVTMLVGFPGSRDSAPSVLVVPGTVIPLSGDSRHRLNPDEDSAERTVELRDLAEKLRLGVGLDSIEIAYSEVYSFAVDKVREVTGPRASSAIRGDLTLLGFNEKLATYRVKLRQGAAVLADSTVTVERGGRAMVGGLDGEEAPYFFILLQPAGKALFVKGDITHPRKVNAPPPLYTEIARRERTQGLVILQALINETGEVEEIEVLEGLPHGLQETAIEALEQWTFEPATLDGKPVSVYYNLTFNFRLQKEKKAEDQAIP